MNSICQQYCEKAINDQEPWNTIGWCMFTSTLSSMLSVMFFDGMWAARVDAKNFEIKELVKLNREMGENMQKQKSLKLQERQKYEKLKELYDRFSCGDDYLMVSKEIILEQEKMIEKLKGHCSENCKE